MMSDNTNNTPPQGSQDNTGPQQSNSAAASQSKPTTPPPTKPTTPSDSSVTGNKNDSSKSGDDKSKTTSSKQQPAPKTKHSPLALLIALVALGAGGYALYQNQYEKPAGQSGDISALKSQISQLQQALDSKADSAQLGSIEQNVSSLEQKVSAQAEQVAQAQEAQQPSGPDEAQISTMIEQQVQTQVNKARLALEQSIASQQPVAAEQADGLDKEQVNTLIKEALANANAARDNNQPVVDFSDEIAAIKQDKADIQQDKAAIQQDKSDIQNYINTIKQQGETIHASIDNALSDAEQKINAAGQRPIVAPLLNTLNLAEIAADAQQYSTAAQYLNLAHDNFADLHLNQAPYAQYADKISALAQQMQQVAESHNSQAQIDSIIANVNSWPFIQTDARNLLDKDDNGQPTESWKADLKRIGGNILSKTITITKNDEAGQTWINQNPYLQQVIRENIRLDLAMVRNALLLGDSARAQSVLETVKAQSARYFDTESDTVKNALATLDELTASSSDTPDIAALIASIKNAG